YGLACVAYECLTGRAFTSSNSTPATRGGGPEVPTPVRSVLARARSPLPSARHASASAFADAFAEAVLSEALAEPPRETPPPINRPPANAPSAPRPAPPQTTVPDLAPYAAAAATEGDAAKTTPGRPPAPRAPRP